MNLQPAPPLHHIWPSILVLSCLLAVAFIVNACSDNSLVSTTSTSGTGTVNVMLSDPATCQSPDGPYLHVYITITDVQANLSGNASSTDSGWTDLTPGLSTSPRQIDLLGQANNQCFLATLGVNTQLQAGNYRQIRLILASNSATVSNNACGNAANCVVLAFNNSVHTLQLSSEAQTGIKIPPGQIASGGFSIAAGQTKDLDIDFDTCNSIVVERNGQFRLKPVLHAGEVSTTSTSISGRVLDHATGNPARGTVLVAAEQRDAKGIDRIQRSTLAASDGTFVFCPLPSGIYDLVIVGSRSDGISFRPSIVTGVPVGSTTGDVRLFLPESTTTSTVTFSGTVTSRNSSMAGTVADVSLSALETVSAITYTIPLPPTSTQSSATLAVETTPTSTTICPTGTNCVNYTLTVPSGGAYAGAWISGNVFLTARAIWAAYVIDGIAFVPGSGNTPNCNPTEVKSQTTTLSSSGPFATTVSTLGFLQCL